MTSFKSKLFDPAERLTGVLCTIPSPVIPQALAASGIDTVIIDMEHGAIDHAAAHAMIAATAGTNCAPMVRVAEVDPVRVKRVLDLGAQGIIFPLVSSVQDAETAVASMKYPPLGIRGFGPFIAQSRWDTTLMEYAAKMQDDLVCVLTIETRQAVEAIEDICQVPGIDMIVPAPFDLSTDLGLMGQFEHPEFIAAMGRVEKAATAAGIPMGNVARAQPQAEALFSRGYRMIADFDILWLRDRAAAFKSWCT